MTNEEAIKTLACSVSMGCSQCDAMRRGDCSDAEVIEALDIARKAIEKQIPKKPVYAATKKYKNIFDGSEVEVHELESCPVCGCYPLETNYVRLPSCPKCNQKIDWGDGE